jgi:hypothetical protein
LGRRVILSAHLVPDLESFVVLDERSSASCAMASWEGRLHLAWTGSDDHLNVMSSPDGQHFEDKRTLPHRSFKKRHEPGPGSTTKTDSLAPALAVTRAGSYLAWTGSDRRLNILGPGLHDGAHEVLAEKSWQPPALGVLGDDVVLAWTGGGRRLNVLERQKGAWGQPLCLEYKGRGSPAICAVGRDIVLAWTGTDRHLNLVYRQNGVWGQPRRLKQKTRHVPAICAAGRETVLAWRGARRYLHLLAVRSGAEPPVRLDARSHTGPAVCAHLDGLAVAWTGSDCRLNVARVRRRL